MANLAMELYDFDTTKRCLLYSLKGLWFDWSQVCGNSHVITFTRRINSEIFQWSSQILNNKKKIIGYVNTGLSVITSER